MKNTRLIFLLLIAMAAPCMAAKYAGEFLEIGVGARAVGMGGAITAITDDPMSFYWNPAGLGYIGGPQVAGMYADLWDGLANYSVAGITLPASGAVLAVNYIRLGVPDIKEFPDLTLSGNRVWNGDTLSIQEYLLATGARPKGIFGDNETALFFSFAKLNRFTLDFGWSFFQLPLEMPIGASVKFVNHKLHGSGGSGIGADFGAQIRVRMSDLFWEKWKGTLAWGFNVQDATRTSLDWGEGNKDVIPTNFRNGLAYIQKLPWRDSRISASWDREYRFEKTDHYGVEFQAANTFALRGGWWGSEWTAGAGISFWRATVDYAYLSRELGNTHRVSVALKVR